MWAKYIPTYRNKRNRKNEIHTSTGEPDNFRRKAITFSSSKSQKAQSSTVLSNIAAENVEMYSRKTIHQRSRRNRSTFDLTPCKWYDLCSVEWRKFKYNFSTQGFQNSNEFWSPPAVSHVLPASLSRPVNKQTHRTKDHGTKDNWQEIN